MSASAAGRPYVGVTGYAELEQALEVYEATRSEHGRRVLMDGYLVRSEDIDPRWRVEGAAPADFSRRYVSIDEAIRALAAPPHGSLRLIHLRTMRHDRLDEQLRCCVDRLGQGVDGFQVNWIEDPDPRDLAAFRHSNDRHRALLGLAPTVMVLQLHPNVLSKYRDRDALTAYVANYVAAGAITDILFDPSGGLGREFQPGPAVSTLQRIGARFPGLGRGVAGGLSPDNVRSMIAPVWSADREVSIDVEGRVRDNADAFSVPMAVAYASAAFALGRRLDAGGGAVP